jgi:hypothetical protein
MPRQVCDLANGRREAIVEDQQIVVGIERKPVGIERTFRRLGGLHKLLCKGTSRREYRETREREGVHEPAAIG